MSDKPDVEQLIERLRAAALDMFHIHDSPSGRQTDRGMAVYLDAAERIIREWASEQLPAWVPVSERLPPDENSVLGAYWVDGEWVYDTPCYAGGQWWNDDVPDYWKPIAPPQAAGRQG